ncbi:hypothetical protein QVD17_26862 [Tagetes erecta]|uniref:Uncharacterized protein n=1 Tax=Tagetes erecta TaxID=13708 RepID=A0AAD8K9T9_TARER|nr:hypothetical protein QVD17_26862 [Tagetes erecta]
MLCSTHHLEQAYCRFKSHSTTTITVLPTNSNLSLSQFLSMEDTDTETCSNNGTIKPDIQPLTFSDDVHNIVSTTPYVSAPSSPADEPPLSHGGGFYYSAPTSPMHHNFSSVSSTHLEDAGGSFEFELSAEPAPFESMTSADELFFNGQIRPMKLSSHLQHPQDLVDVAPLVAGHEIEDGEDVDRKYSRARVFQPRDRRRKARSMSPLRSNTAFQWLEDINDGREATEIKEKLEAEDKQRTEDETETPSSGASSRSSSVGRSSKRWVFLKELLYRSKSEGRNTNNSNRNHKFWSTLSFSPSSGKKSLDAVSCKTVNTEDESRSATAKKAVNGVGMNNRKRRTGRSASAHEVHYNRNRAQAEEMRKKTYLPYRQGLLGCLGFSSKSYGAMNGFARALNPVSSR